MLQADRKSILDGQVAPTRAVLYAPVSGDDRKYASSGIESQLKDGKKYAAAKGYHIVGEFYEDPEQFTSGADWLPELQKVIELARQGGFDVLVVREVDRLARNRFKQMSVEVALEEAGARVEYVIGQYADTAEGKLLKGLMSEFAEYERSKIKERTSRGRLRQIEKGNILIGGSYAPYGYDIHKTEHTRTLVINDREAEVVKTIFRLYALEGYSLHGIVGYLDDRNIPKPMKGNNHKARSKKSGKNLGWSPGTISGILNNEVYVGRWYYRKTKRVKDRKTGKYRNIKRPKSEWLLVEVPPIVPDSHFSSAANRREQNKRVKGKNRKNDYLLGGMCKCGHCGNGASGITKVQGEKQWSYYKCNAHHLPKRYGFKCENSVQFRAEWVDAAVWHWLREILIDPDRLNGALDDYKKKMETVNSPVINMIEANEKRLAELRAELERLIDAYTKGIIGLDDLAAKKAQLDGDITKLTQAISQLQADLADRQTITPAQIETVKQFADQIKDDLLTIESDFEAMRYILSLLNTQVNLVYEDGKRFADVKCVLGEELLPTDTTTTLSIVRKSAK